jgi:ABC-type lipoprotein release transport system permease subunit
MDSLGVLSYISLAFRNLLRKPGRTGITLATMIFGIATLTLLSALNDGWLNQMKENFILSFTGHVQVHAQGFEASQNLRDRMETPERVVRHLHNLQSIIGWTQRIRSSGLASRGSSSAGVQILAIDPEQETWVTSLHTQVSEGRWLNPGMANDLLLGAEVASSIGVELGGRVILMAQQADGEMVSEVFILRGIIRTGAPQIDRTLALIALRPAQIWLDMGDSVTDVVIRGATHEDTEAVKRYLGQFLSLSHYEIMAWQELDPMVRQWLNFSDAYGLVIILIVVILVVTEILNTMLIALHDRQKELGVMVALGTRRHQVFFMLLYEAVFLILLGGAVGYIAGGGVIEAFSAAGIDLSGFSNAFQFFYMNPVIRPELTFDSALRILGTTLVSACLAGVYPAWKATRLSVSQSLRVQ